MSEVSAQSLMSFSSHEEERRKDLIEQRIEDWLDKNGVFMDDPGSAKRCPTKNSWDNRKLTMDSPLMVRRKKNKEEKHSKD